MLGKFLKTLLYFFILFLLFIFSKNFFIYKNDINIAKELSQKNKIFNVKNQEKIKIKKQEIIREKERIELEKAKELEKNKNTFSDNTQFVMLVFDGSRSNKTWQKTLDFAKQMNESGKRLQFTYFISGVYLLPKSQKNLYNLSWKGPGKSDINFGDDLETTNKRIDYINRAIDEKHEIASHLNGHFDGSKWTENQWTEEITLFNNILDNTLDSYIKRNIKLKIDSKDIYGIRSPLLSKNKNLYSALSKMNIKYDTSKIDKIGKQPQKDIFGVWQFHLVSLRLDGKRTLSMDYNHYIAQTKGKSILKKGTPEWVKAKKEVVDAYTRYFNKEYGGNRAPVNIGHHFSMWNDGVYWEAMKDFARNTCGKPDVVCTNYKTLVKYLELKEKNA